MGHYIENQRQNIEVKPCFILFSLFLQALGLILLLQCTNNKQSNISNKRQEKTMVLDLKINKSNNHKIEKAFRIAIGDIYTNIQFHKSGILNEEKPCILAGLFYDKPWTRDAAINVWNGCGLLFPQEAKNTLLAQLGKDKNNENEIIGQYWDKIIWSLGVWQYYLYSGDIDFLKLAYKAITNTLEYLENNEFSEDLNLFRGAAVYGDGVASYPEIYTQHQEKTKNGAYGCILDWVGANPDRKAKSGYGLPMHALSTNCVYYRTYTLLPDIAKELGIENDLQWAEKADQLKKAINKHFWNEAKASYKYLIDPFGNSDAQEGLGLSFAILFGIADEQKIESIFKTVKIEPAGIPCVYPSFKRYRNEKIDSYGRHSGTVWPHVQGFWADAAKRNNEFLKFDHEINELVTHVVRDNQFVEIYHPKTGLPYGGIQEPDLTTWKEMFCAERQTWSASAYLRMILMDIAGMQFNVDGIEFHPYLPEGINNFRLKNLKYRNTVLEINISGDGSNLTSFKINGNETEPFLKKDLTGNNKIQIILSK